MATVTIHRPVGRRSILPLGPPASPREKEFWLEAVTEGESLTGSILTHSKASGGTGTGPILTVNATPAAGGAGYAASDVLTVPSGNGDAAVTVDTVDGSGAVVTYHISDPGSGYGLANDVAAGAAANPGHIRTTTIQNAGSFYAPGDTGFIVGGDSGATYVIDSVDAGAVATYHLTAPGSGYLVETGYVTTATSGAGTGAGFRLNITAVSSGFTFEILSVLGYAVDDTGTMNGGNGLAAYLVDSINDDGTVETYHLTDAGDGYAVGVDGTTPGGAQPGVGSGFTISVDSITPTGAPSAEALSLVVRRNGANVVLASVATDAP